MEARKLDLEKAPNDESQNEIEDKPSPNTKPNKTVSNPCANVFVLTRCMPTKINSKSIFFSPKTFL